jgi:N-acetylglucosaminyl-diphospho-decaprenol L-rhamnosyltransferase
MSDDIMIRPELSIVIVSFNTREDLERCLASLATAPPAAAHEIVVVDNASHDGSPEAVRARWPGSDQGQTSVRVLVQPRNIGFAAANNIGIRATSGDLVLLLNSDTIVPAGALDALVGRLRAHPDAAVAGPRLVDGHGRVELSFGPMISPLAELRQKLTIALHQRQFGPVAGWVARATSHEHVVDWVSGAALLVHRKDAEAVGLLDERYFLYTEDVDFCAALRARGRRILFTPAATITHLRGRSRATAPSAMNAAYRRSQIAFYEKHHPRWAPLLRAYLRLKGQLREAEGR